MIFLKEKKRHASFILGASGSIIGATAPGLLFAFPQLLYAATFSIGTISACLSFFFVFTQFLHAPFFLHLHNAQTMIKLP